MTGHIPYDALLLAWVLLAPATALLLLFISAPYGRHARSGWGPRIDARLAWVVMEAPSPVLITAWFVYGRAWADPALCVFLAMWLVHYLHRAFIYPARMSATAKPMPLLIAAMGAGFNVVNTLINGWYLFLFKPAYGWQWLADPRFALGALLFVVGFAINLHSDEVLRRLRAPGESGYKIPHGGLHRWVASPNYLGEIVEWWGFALATWSLPGVAFALWTTANLAPRARSHLAWYRETFDDYPEERRAVLPYVL